MKKRFIKPLAIMALSATAMFGCASSEEAGSTAAEQDMGSPAVVETETEVIEEPVIETTETEMLSNEDVSYDEIFGDVENTEQYDLLTLVKLDPNLSTFAGLLERSGLETSLQRAEPVTLLIPTNSAFEEMDRERYQELTDPNNLAALTQFVNMHILPSKVYKMGFNTTQIIETEGENEIPVDTRMNGEVVYIGGAEIVKPDVVASNGLIHVVNRVVEPSEFSNVTTD